MRFVITLRDEEFAKLSDRSQYLTETLVMPGGKNIEVIIQREDDMSKIVEATVDTGED